VIVGGMSFGTILTLFVVPAFYTFFARKMAHLPAQAKKIPAEPASATTK
jgi:multidrug efflux pump